MYKTCINNEDIGIYTSLLYLPWVIKPLWSPFIDLYSTKENGFSDINYRIAF
jgi:PAT family beta-lactamase induction signal transducer AmpG